MRAGRDAFEVTRAAWLDRLAGQIRVLHAVGDAMGAEAVLDEYLEALAATGHDDWVATVTRGALARAETTARHRQATEAFVRMLVCLLEALGGAPPPDRPAWRESARLAGEELLAADPGFRLADAVYARRVPWTGAGRARLAGWIAELGLPAADVEAAVAADPVAEMEQAAARWEERLGPRRPGPPEAGTPPRDPNAAAAAGALLARAEEALDRQPEWPDPLVAHHWRALREALREATTATEVDLIAFHADACFAIEADWNVVLQTVCGLPFRAAAAHDPALATRTAHSLTGLGPPALAQLAPVRRVLERIAGDPAHDPSGAFQGEAGFDVLNAARDAGVTRPQDLTPPGPPAEPRALTLWDRELDLAGLGSISPARPGL